MLIIFSILYVSIIVSSWVIPIFLRGVAEGQNTTLSWNYDVDFEEMQIMAVIWPAYLFIIPLLPFIAIYYIIFYFGKLIGFLLKK